MTFNECKTCHAKDGRCGTLIEGECLNCRNTRKLGDFILFDELIRTDEEIERTFSILNEKQED